jgi:predicted nuclease of predicted toxin-antitoxin system
MNLSPAWLPVLEAAGHSVVHWVNVGAPSAPDTELMTWARNHGHVVFTHDLDYGALLFATEAIAPSVLQLRSEDTRPSTLGNTVLAALNQLQDDLAAGALVTIDPRRHRSTLLPLRRKR